MAARRLSEVVVQEWKTSAQLKVTVGPLSRSRIYSTVDLDSVTNNAVSARANGSLTQIAGSAELARQAA